jgi:hypothetical protein
MSKFDPDTFLGQETDQIMDTHFKPVPEGEYTAMIDTVVAKEVNDSPVLDITYVILDEAVKVEMNSERVSVRQSIFVEMEDDGRIALGDNKNVKLGKLREALGQNSGIWSPRKLAGAGPVKIKTVNKPDKIDPETIYSNVQRVTAA